MITFTDCKINLGLYVTARRPDGYHDVETVMYPVDWHDILETIPAPNCLSSLQIFGRHIDCEPEKNLVMKALRALESFVGKPLPTSVKLQKIVPDGAGLGGGSADAAFTLKALNRLYSLDISSATLASIASSIGADCPFFIENRPALCTGIGTSISSIDLDLSPYSILIAKPKVAAVSTRDAYASITPRAGRTPLTEILSQPVGSWRGTLVNDFEPGIFKRLPRVAEVKDLLYSSGALYASMSGSGAALFGIFTDDNLARRAADTLADCDCHLSPSPSR